LEEGEGGEVLGVGDGRGDEVGPVEGFVAGLEPGLGVVPGAGAAGVFLGVEEVDGGGGHQGGEEAGGEDEEEGAHAEGSLGVESGFWARGKAERN
jgi:hypothetical protein